MLRSRWSGTVALDRHCPLRLEAAARLNVSPASPLGNLFWGLAQVVLSCCPFAFAPDSFFCLCPVERKDRLHLNGKIYRFSQFWQGHMLK